MTRILVLGGYGGFGGGISRRLAAAGHEVLVAGRSMARATAFCADAPGLTPVVVDRRDIPEALNRYRPFLLVDASGPFQAMDHVVPAACIAAGVHYIDIADARSFVCGIAALDAEARAAGVVVVSGASSVPALSGAAVRHLAADMERVRAVEMAISASNRATAGPAVAAAILGQVGQPMTLWRGGRCQGSFGWHEMRAMDFAVAGLRPLRRRWLALVDVPDLALLPERLPGRPAVTFRAGTELAFQNWAVRIAAWLVRRRLVASLAPLAPCLSRLQALTRRLGGERSAMIVRLFGDAAGRKVERRWTLIADKDDGPEIPTLSVAPLVARIMAGDERPGARDAGLSLELAAYEQAFAGLAIRHATEEIAAPQCLYERVMGERFTILPKEVRDMHDVWRDGGGHGEADVEGPSGLLAGWIARLAGFPPPGRHSLHVHFEERDGRETWTRDFGGRRFSSCLSQRGTWLIERFGALRFAFDLPSDDKGLTMVMRRWWFGPLRLPLALAPRSIARAWAEDGRFHFDVPIALPLIGRLVHYRGWLKG